MPFYELRGANVLDGPINYFRTTQQDLQQFPFSWHQRLDRWLAGSYHAVVFERNGEALGYALFRATDPDLKGPGGVYLRQFYIRRDGRRAGAGREAFELLVQEVLEPGQRVVLEALASNPGGQDFWRAIGLTEYAITFQSGDLS